MQLWTKIYCVWYIWYHVFKQIRYHIYIDTHAWPNIVFFFSSLGFNEKLLTKQKWFFFKIIFSSFWALQFPNLLLSCNFDPFSYMGYIYIYIYIYIYQTTYFCKQIRHKMPYIYGNSYMGYIWYISQTTYVCKEIENRTKIKWKKWEKTHFKKSSPILKAFWQFLW